jgi:hypothetical protein
MPDSAVHNSENPEDRFAAAIAENALDRNMTLVESETQNPFGCVS